MRGRGIDPGYCEVSGWRAERDPSHDPRGGCGHGGMKCYKKVWGSSKYEFEEPHGGLRMTAQTFTRATPNHPVVTHGFAELPRRSVSLSLPICLTLRFGVEQFLQDRDKCATPIRGQFSRRPVEVETRFTIRGGAHARVDHETMPRSGNDVPRSTVRNGVYRVARSARGSVSKTTRSAGAPSTRPGRPSQARARQDARRSPPACGMPAPTSARISSRISPCGSDPPASVPA